VNLEIDKDILPQIHEYNTFGDLECSKEEIQNYSKTKQKGKTVEERKVPLIVI
jgi:hypothetical protein